jgi:hypothetical protein
MPVVGFEPTILAFERAKTVHALIFSRSAFTKTIVHIVPGLRVRIAYQYKDGLWAALSGFDSRRGKIVLFSVASRPVLRPTQPPRG